MNERIRELAIQAGFGEQWFEEHPTGCSLPKPLMLKEYTELIVRECIGCCEQVISDPVPESVDTWLNGGEQCIQEIKKHFGVEE